MTAPGLGDEAAVDYLAGLQERIAAQLAEFEPKKAVDDRWERTSGLSGNGRSMLVEGGSVIERGGVNFSHVCGSKLPPSASARMPELAGAPFEAAGLSLVLHPANPYAPTVHMNVRHFRVDSGAGFRSWVGGGMDLTPYYGFDEDCVHFHRVCRDALDVIDREYYPRFKKWCDEYFQLPHRGEPRGVGGIFYDDVDDIPPDHQLDLTRAVGDAFANAYFPILGRRKDTPFGESERGFQLYRRSRYVEFNLLYDRGTLFGLQSGGRTESILMSMPPHAAWQYRREDPEGSQERRLTEHYLIARDWLKESG